MTISLLERGGTGPVLFLLSHYELSSLPLSPSTGEREHFWPFPACCAAFRYLNLLSFARDFHVVRMLHYYTFQPHPSSLLFLWSHIVESPPLERDFFQLAFYRYCR